MTGAGAAADVLLMSHSAVSGPPSTSSPETSTSYGVVCQAAGAAGVVFVGAAAEAAAGAPSRAKNTSSANGARTMVPV